MWIYIFNFVSILLYGLVIRNKKALISVISLQLLLILSLRDPLLGVDNKLYMAAYNYISELHFSDVLSRLHLIKVAELIYPYSLESGYVLINWIVSALGFDFHGFLVLHAVFCVFALAKFVYRYSDDPTLSFVFFISFPFFSYQFGILRQTLVLALFILSIPLIKERKFLKYLAVCFLAFTIHRLGVILVPLYFVYNIKMTKKCYVRCGILLGVFFLSSPLLVKKIVIPVLILFNKLRSELELSFNWQILIMIALAVCILIFASFETQFVNNSDHNFLCWCFLYAIAIEILGMYDDVIARAIYVPYIAVVALIPNVLKRYKHLGISFIGRTILIVGLFAFMLYSMSEDFINPYISCF